MQPSVDSPSVNSAFSTYRNVTLALAASSFLVSVAPAFAGPDACDISGTSATCEGDQSGGLSAGIDFPTSITDLQVDPTGSIVPPVDEHGIFGIFDTSLGLANYSAIYTSGSGETISIEAPGFIDIMNRGDLDSARRGIYARSYGGPVTIDSIALIFSGEDGVFAQGDGLVQVDSKGDIDAGFKGIFANSFSGGAEVYSNGNITAFFDAIWVQGNGDVSIWSKGELVSESYSRGIFANSFGGSVSVWNEGDIFADLDSIWAQGQYNVTIWSEGNLTGTDEYGEGRGIFANSFLGSVDIYSDGDIVSNLDGIWATGLYGVNIESHGDITNPKYSRGIYALSGLGPVSIMTEGNIDAYLDTIWARGHDEVSVYNRGDLNSRNFGHGIFAESLSSTVMVDSKGDIVSDLDGIFARGPESVSVKNRGDISAPHSFGDQRGIFAQSLGGEVHVDHKGDIDVTLESIWAQGTEKVTVKSEGDLNSTRSSSKGIFASSFFNEVSVENKGDINSSHEAIFATGWENVTVKNEGDLTADQFRALFASSSTGAVHIDNKGDISATSTLNNGDAIFATGADGVWIDSVGDITSNSFRGIFAHSDGGPVVINSKGDISANGSTGSNGEAIFVDIFGDVKVDSTGNLFSNEFRGVFLQSRAGTVDFTSKGDIDAEFEGVFLSGDNVVADIRGDVTSTDWRGILVSRAIAGDADGSIELTFGGGTVKSEGTDPDEQPHAIEVDPFGGTSVVTIEKSGTVLEQNNVMSGNYSYGILFKDGTNLLKNHGQIITTDSAGRAIGGEDGDETIENMGLVAGSVYLGGGMNAFNNREGGLFETGDFIDLGFGNALTNWGDVSPGGLNNYQTTTFLSGDFIQESSGELIVDVDFDTPNTSDLITGVDNADMNGTVRANLQDVNLIFGNTQTVTILEADNVTDSGITGAAQGAVEVTVITDPTNVDITVGLNFAAAGLQGNQDAMGDYLQQIFMDGVPGQLEPAFYELVGIPTTQAYGNAIATLGPDGFGGVTYPIYEANDFLTNNLFSCPVAAPISEGGSRYSDEGQCGWLVATARRSEMDGSAGSFGFDDDSAGIAGGIQTNLGGDRRFGIAMGYESGDYNSGNVSGDRELIQFGAVLKDRFDGNDVAIGVTGGMQQVDATRFIPLLGGLRATSEQDQQFVAVTGRLARTFESDWGYFEPSVMASAIWIDRDGFTEKGAGPLNLKVRGGSETALSVTPALEFGTEFTANDGSVVRPYIRGGVTWQSLDDLYIVAGFAGLTQVATLTSERDSVYGDVAAGVDVLTSSGWSFRAEYKGQFSSNSESHTGMIKARVNF